MATGKNSEEVDLRFEFDRLGCEKLSLVYRLLVPILDETKNNSIVQIDDYEEISCDIHEGIF